MTTPGLPRINALIPARGGSAGVPNKNLYPLNSKPMLSYAIEAALRSMAGANTYVSSDSDEILAVARTYGAQPVKRPAEISTPKSKSEEALLHFLSEHPCDILVFIQPTSPLLKSHYVDAGIRRLLENPALNSVFSVFEEHWIPRWTADFKPIDWEIADRPMRQDRPSVFVENGAFYISRAAIVQQKRLRYWDPMEFIVMQQSESIQADTLDDLTLISKLL